MADVIVLLLSIGLGWGLSSGPWTQQLPIAVALLIAWMIFLDDAGSRARTVLGSGPEEYRRVVKAGALATALGAVVAYAADWTDGRSFLFITAAIAGVALLVERHVLRVHLRRTIARGRSLNRVFLVGADGALRQMRDQVVASGGLFLEVGAWDHGLRPPDGPADFVAAARAADADALLYAPGPDLPADWTRRLGWALEGTGLTLLVSSSVREVTGARLRLEPVAGLAVVKVDPPTLSGPARAVKRAIDIIGAVVGLVVLGLPMLVIGLLIRSTSPGPAVFIQDRVGEGGQTFPCWKFRTMRVGADREREVLRAEHGTGGATFKMEHDPRVTPVGRVLRRCSLDELPQLVNVLRGQMSLVGPRPHPLDDVMRYDVDDHRRLLTRPGMTGLWQVSGRSTLTWDEAVALDLHYVENWSLSMDLVIFLRTAKAVVVGDGAH